MLGDTMQFVVTCAFRKNTSGTLFGFDASESAYFSSLRTPTEKNPWRGGLSEAHLDYLGSTSQTRQSQHVLFFAPKAEISFSSHL